MRREKGVQRFALAIGIALLAAGVAGCGGGGGGGGRVTPDPPSARFEDQFGSASGFGAIFRQPATSEPREAVPGDVIAVNPTAEPVTVP